ncbi:MAG: hypothetical protein ACPGYF_01955 [Chitinophagales bacterium]
MTSSTISRYWVFLGNELRAELRHLQGLAAQTMFVVVASYLLYAGLVLLGHAEVSNQVIQVIFWLVMIFTIVNSTSSSFFRDASGRDLYYYSLLHPLVYFVGKLLSSFVATLFHSLLLTLIFHQVFACDYMVTFPWFAVMFCGVLGMTTLFTLIASMASKTSQSQILAVVLGFPLAIPLLLFILKNLSSIDLVYAQDFSLSSLSSLLIFDGLILGLSLLLFPYIWGD